MDLEHETGKIGDVGKIARVRSKLAGNCEGRGEKRHSWTTVRKRGENKRAQTFHSPFHLIYVLQVWVLCARTSSSIEVIDKDPDFFDRNALRIIVFETPPAHYSL